MIENTKSFDATKLDDEHFRDLNKSRSKMVRILSLGSLTLYLINMLMMSVFSDIGSTSLSQTSNINVGIALSVGIVVLGIVLAAFYAWWANRVLDKKREIFLRKINS